MEMAKVTSKGQITIPISIRKRLDIKEGDKILFLDRAEGVIMLNPDMLQKETAEIIPTGIPSEVQAGSTQSILSGESNTSVPENTVLNQTVADSPIAAATTVTMTPATAQTTAQTTVPTTAQTEAFQTTTEVITTQNEKPGAENLKKSVGDVDLSTLLDEIRSFNTNI